MVEFEVFGKTRGFKLGTYTFKLINQEADTKTVQDVFSRLKESDHSFVCTFYFCCAKHWAMSTKNEIDFTEVDVADWIDELGEKRASEITSELFKVYTGKNQTAPETGQELQSSNGAILQSSN